MPGIADRSMVKNVIRSQQRKLREEMKDIVKQKATQSAYPALSRQDKRVAEFHHDRLTQEQSLQKDTKKAERLARRIAQILDQLRKDFNKIKNFLGNYNFANTVGQDSSCDGACAEDLSTAVDTRQAWKRELENMLTMVWHYVDAQHLGDYALLHQPESTSDPTCGSSSTPVNCCPKVYRPFFHYYTPDGDCLGMATEAGGHSGNSQAVTSQTTAYGNESTVGNYNGRNGTTLLPLVVVCLVTKRAPSMMLPKVQRLHLVPTNISRLLTKTPRFVSYGVFLSVFKCYCRCQSLVQLLVCQLSLVQIWFWFYCLGCRRG